MLILHVSVDSAIVHETTYTVSIQNLIPETTYYPIEHFQCSGFTDMDVGLTCPTMVSLFLLYIYIKIHVHMKLDKYKLYT